MCLATVDDDANPESSIPLAMCRATVDDDRGFRPRVGRRLEVQAFYLRLSSSTAPPPPKELSLVYRPAIGGPALELAGRKLPPASPAEATLLRMRADDGAYASADRVSAADGARFEVYAGEELAAEGVFLRRDGGTTWRVECRRAVAASLAVVAEVLVLAEGGVLLRGKARAVSARGVGCGTTRLERIPEEVVSSWGCECGEEWEVVDDDGDEEWKKGQEEMETVRWALEMGAWAVCVGVGLLATARRFRRKRAFR